jgi:hypothetical protein
MKNLETRNLQSAVVGLGPPQPDLVSIPHGKKLAQAEVGALHSAGGTASLHLNLHPSLDGHGGGSGSVTAPSQYPRLIPYRELNRPGLVQSTIT